jgi:hypothetical protein
MSKSIIGTRSSSAMRALRGHQSPSSTFLTHLNNVFLCFDILSTFEGDIESTNYTESEIQISKFKPFLADFSTSNARIQCSIFFLFSKQNINQNESNETEQYNHWRATET